MLCTRDTPQKSGNDTTLILMEDLPVIAFVGFEKHFHKSYFRRVIFIEGGLAEIYGIRTKHRNCLIKQQRCEEELKNMSAIHGLAANFPRTPFVEGVAGGPHFPRPNISHPDPSSNL